MKPPSYIYKVVIQEDTIEDGKTYRVDEHIVIEANSLEQVIKYCEKQPGFIKIVEFEEIGYKVVDLTSENGN